MNRKQHAIAALDEQHRRIRAEIMAASHDAEFSVVSGVGITPAGGWELDVFSMAHGTFEHNLTTTQGIALTALKEAQPHMLTRWICAFANGLLLGMGLEPATYQPASTGNVPCGQTQH
ncbi:MAG: hypothetical protein ABF990_11990 [Acetobacter sp.]|uniref:hypothetical protein n=1 Tax=Acetobacter sp. TaxID=440 RepID=UPI0039E840D4